GGPRATTSPASRAGDDSGGAGNGHVPGVRGGREREAAQPRQYLDALPAGTAMKQRIETLIGSSAAYFNLRVSAGTLFAMKFDPAKQQPFLVTLRSADDTAGARVVVDPNVKSDKGGTAIDFYVPSPDGRL